MPKPSCSIKIKLTMNRKNTFGILLAAVVIVASVLLISRYITRRTPMIVQGTVECTTYRASSKIPGRIATMLVGQGDPSTRTSSR